MASSFAEDDEMMIEEQLAIRRRKGERMVFSISHMRGRLGHLRVLKAREGTWGRF